MIKASAGGGGKGMRMAHNEITFLKNFETAKMEAKNAFGSEEIYIEKLIENPRHIEIQVFGDGNGKGIHFLKGSVLSSGGIKNFWKKRHL